MKTNCIHCGFPVADHLPSGHHPESWDDTEWGCPKYPYMKARAKETLEGFEAALKSVFMSEHRPRNQKGVLRKLQMYNRRMVVSAKCCTECTDFGSYYHGYLQGMLEAALANPKNTARVKRLRAWILKYKLTGGLVGLHG